MQYSGRLRTICHWYSQRYFIKYNPGDELPDLGSWVCTDARGMVRDYEGLSKDVSKLPHYVQSGSSALCLDTSELYEYHKPTDTWYKL